MDVWVDGDSCVRQVREFLISSAERRGYRLSLVGDRPLSVPKGRWWRFFLVETGADAADTWIAESVVPGGDLVVTRDIPLAARLVDLEVRVLNDRGVVYTKENVGARLKERHLKQDLRAQGLVAEGPRSYSVKDYKEFTQAFDRELTKLLATERLKG
ncbi:MAG: DUF188 domain-containing protein [Spirochaetales bacterium]|nr:DUF188 domain-containing protein [Spirochaetales bacterium]